MLESRGFDMHKNATTPIIAMLGCLKLDTEVLDAGMETVESNDYREMSRNDRDANSVLC